MTTKQSDIGLRFQELKSTQLLLRCTKGLFNRITKASIKLKRQRSELIRAILEKWMDQNGY